MKWPFRKVSILLIVALLAVIGHFRYLNTREIPLLPYL